MLFNVNNVVLLLLFLWRIIGFKVTVIFTIGGMNIFTIVNDSVLKMCIMNLNLTVLHLNYEFVHNCERFCVELLHFATFDRRFHMWRVKIFTYVNSSAMNMLNNILGLTISHPYCECLDSCERLWIELLHYRTCDCWDWHFHA